MDRDNNRERIQKSYDEIMFGQLQTSDTPCEYLAKQYELGLTDEFLPPVCFMDAEQVEDGDTIFHLNFRSDRGRELTQAIMVSCNPALAKEYTQRPSNGWTLKNLRNIYLVTMTKYYKEYDGHLFIKPMDIKNTLGEVLAHNERRQLHIAETEKYAHVTKFFNGDKNIVYDGEKDVLVPSHKVDTFDHDPEMSAEEILNVFLKQALDYEFVVVNFANGDIVGHT
jgi:2,3-bisphosphoglycerate-independent phosphoglycerate mutase